MTTTFRKTLMATTMLVGLAIFALDAAQAGPNGGPSLGSISGFSSMRMDFNRVGGPNRALSRDDTRVVPLDVKKAEKSKDTKNAAKKGTDIARVSNPKPVTGGKGKEVASAPALRIPAPLAELYRVTGGNLDDISQLAELASWLKTGLPALGSPLFPAKGDDGSFVLFPAKGDGSFVSPTLGADGRFGWGDTKGGPGNNTPQRITNPDGKVAGGSDGGSVTTWGAGWRRTDTWKRNPDGSRDHHTFWIYKDGSTAETDERFEPDGDHTMTASATDADGNNTATHYVNGWPIPVPADESADKKTGDADSDPKEKAEKEKDSQPTEEGTGRSRGMHTVRCDIAGCIDYGMKDGRRTNPGHGTDGSGGVGAGGSALPSWAVNPCPDCGTRVSGGGGFDRPGGSDLGWRGHGEGEDGFNPIGGPR